MRSVDPALFADRDVLLVAPHPDDEALGCGGLVVLLARAGARVRTAVMASGAGGVGGGATPEERERESLRCCEHLGVPPPLFARLSSAELRADPAAAAARLDALLGPCSFALLLLPSPLERHPTHQASLLAALLASSAAGAEAAWGYGAWDAIPVTPGTLEVDIGAARTAKTLAMASHLSQMRERPFAAGMASRDMSQAIFSRFTGAEPRKAVERLLDLGTLPARVAALRGRPDTQEAARRAVNAWLDECAAAWNHVLWSG